uniref:hypothetical protein n=1 Tax=Thaumasiovibrio occultus TaxID=1891184 RepID=UPI00131C241F|nr:hypothetical protein [Thaumasiovibrio occultus]
MKPCPSCHQPAISNVSMFRSTAGVGGSLSCSLCGERCSVSKTWQHLFAVSVVLGLAFSIALSVHYRSVLPYGLVLLVMMSVLGLASRCASLTAVVSKPRNKIIDGLVFGFFAVSLGALFFRLYPFL